MGVLSQVVLFPLAPVRGVVWVADRLMDAAERELFDPSVVRARLAALNEALETGCISFEEFDREEDRLLDLLERPPDQGHRPPDQGPRRVSRRGGPLSKGRARGGREEGVAEHGRPSTGASAPRRRTEPQRKRNEAP